MPPHTPDSDYHYADSRYDAIIFAAAIDYYFTLRRFRHAADTPPSAFCHAMPPPLIAIFALIFIDYATR
jgi:hypothetical protein